MGCIGSGEIRATDGKGKAPTSLARMWLVGLDILDTEPTAPAGSCSTKCKNFNGPRAVSLFLKGIRRHEHA
jgi:hypothetical protein